MKIVRASEKDIPIIVEMKMKMFQELNSITLLQDHAQNKIKQVYKSLYQEDKLCHFMIYEEGEIVAIGGAVIKEDIPFCFFKTPYYGYVLDVYCVPEKRRNGYATEIMNYTLKWLEEKEVHNIKLKPSTIGRKLYEKLDFQISDEMEKWV